MGDKDTFNIMREQFTLKERAEMAAFLRRLALKKQEPYFKNLGICANLLEWVDTNAPKGCLSVYDLVSICCWPQSTGQYGYPVAGEHERGLFWDFRTRNGKRRRALCLWLAAAIQNGL